VLGFKPPLVLDVLGKNLDLAVLHEVNKGRACFHTKESGAEIPEMRVTLSVTALEEINPGILEGLMQAPPRAGSGPDLGRVTVDGSGEVDRVLADELNEDGASSIRRSPITPVRDVSLKLHHPESIKQSRIHVGDGVLAALVDCGNHSSFRVTSSRKTVRTVTKHSIKNDLEHRVLDAGKPAVDLVEEKINGLVASPHVPRGKSETSHASSLNFSKVRDTDDVALLHGRSSSIDHRAATRCSNLTNSFGLTDTVITLDENRDMRRNHLEKFLETRNIH
jgi:hypothetical protein